MRRNVLSWTCNSYYSAGAATGLVGAPRSPPLGPAMTPTYCHEKLVGFVSLRPIWGGGLQPPSRLTACFGPCPYVLRSNPTLLRRAGGDRVVDAGWRPIRFHAGPTQGRAVEINGRSQHAAHRKSRHPALQVRDDRRVALLDPLDRALPLQHALLGLEM
jgi:hypothetical protein